MKSNPGFVTRDLPEAMKLLAANENNSITNFLNSKKKSIYFTEIQFYYKLLQQQL